MLRSGPINPSVFLIDSFFFGVFGDNDHSVGAINNVVNDYLYLFFSMMTADLKRINRLSN